MNARSAVAVLILLLVTAPASAAPQRDDFWCVNGQVFSVVNRGNTLYVGGLFDRVGPASGGLVAVDATTGAATMPPLLVDGHVHAILADGAGGIYIGGEFQHVQGQNRSNLARISGDGTLLPWNPNAGGRVLAITRIGGTVYVGGDFSQVGGITRNFLAAVDTSSGALQPWNPGANGTVSALQALSGLVYVGGSFNTVAGTGRNRIAALDGSTGAATAWNPNCNGNVYTLIVRFEGVAVTAYVGGNFTSIGGQARTNLAAIDANALSATFGQATTFAPNPNGAVTSMRTAGVSVTVLYVGGTFTSIAGQQRGRAAEFIAGSLQSWNPGASGDVWSIHLGADGNTIYLGGDFTILGGQNRNRAGAVNSSGTAVTNGWDPQPWGIPTVFASSGSNLWMGGAFSAIGGQARQNLAALDLVSGQATAWNPGANNTVYALKWIGDDLYAGGAFGTIAGTSRPFLARFDQAGALTPWNAQVNGTVHAIASRPLDATTSLVYLGGQFQQVRDSARTYLAAVTTATPPVVTGWKPFANGSGRCLELDATHVYVGGTFTTLGSFTGSGLGRVDFAGNVDSWHPDLPYVLDLELAGSDVYAAAYDPAPPGFDKFGVVKRIPKSSDVETWTTYADGSGQALRVGAEGLDTGGSFIVLDQGIHRGMGRLDSATGDALSFDLGVNQIGGVPTVFDLLEANGLLIVAGDFSAADGKPRAGIAAFYDGVLATPARPAGTVVLRAAPNPARSSQGLSFELASRGAARITIHDVGGRLVRVLVDGTLEAGPHRHEWDGRSADGARAAPGIYFARLETRDLQATTKLLRID